MNALTHTREQTPEQALLHLDQQLCFALYSTSLAMTKVYKPLLDQLGLTYPQYLVMLILWQNDALELQQIGEQLQIASGALTPVLKRMEKMGLLQRSRNPQNERALQIRLTQSGWAMRATAAGKVQINRQISAKSGMVDTEIQALRQELVQLRQQLNSAL